MSRGDHPRIPMSRRAAQPRPTRVPPPQLDPSDEDLREELELACLDTLRGDPPGEIVARRLELACRRVLEGRGVKNALVRATSGPRGTRLVIGLPGPDDRVEQLVLTMG